MSKSKTKQKKSSAAKNIAIFFIVFVILEGLIIFGITRLFKTEDTVVKIGGYSFFLMDSDNMGADAPKNALVIASNGTPAKDKVGLAVLCKNVEGEGTTVAWLYDIGSKGDTVDGVVYTVYQEANRDKMFDLSSDDIVGVATSYYQTAGNIVAFVKTPFGMAICIIAPLFLLVLIELIIAIAHRSHDDDYDDDDYDDEQDSDENVTLDDFLYGGENDDVYTSSKPKDTYEEEFEDKYAAMMNRESQNTVPELHFDGADTAPVFEENYPPYASEETETAAPESKEPTVEVPKPQIAPEYYEKASKMIDEAVTAHEEESKPAETAVEEPVKSEPKKQAAAPKKKPAQRRPANSQQRRTKPAAQHQDANAALAELMKMMEEEQKKLRNTNGDK